MTRSTVEAGISLTRSMLKSSGLGPKAQGLGFRVWGLGFWVRVGFFYTWRLELTFSLGASHRSFEISGLRMIRLWAGWGFVGQKEKGT